MYAIIISHLSFVLTYVPEFIVFVYPIIFFHSPIDDKDFFDKNLKGLKTKIIYEKDFFDSNLKG